METFSVATKTGTREVRTMTISYKAIQFCFKMWKRSALCFKDWYLGRSDNDNILYGYTLLFSDVETFSVVTKTGISEVRTMISVDNSRVGKCSLMILSALIVAPRTVVILISIRNKIHCTVLQNKLILNI